MIFLHFNTWTYQCTEPNTVEICLINTEHWEDTWFESWLGTGYHDTGCMWSSSHSPGKWQSSALKGHHYQFLTHPFHFTAHSHRFIYLMSFHIKISSVCIMLLYSLWINTYSMVQNITWRADCHSAYQKISCFLYGIWRFITMFTKARHWTLSWASWIQFAPLIPISLRSNLILSSHLCLRLPVSYTHLTLPTKRIV